MWWGKISLDRTIGIQYLIALSQKVFGENFHSIYVPTTIAACLFLYFTYVLHKELIGDKNAIVSPLILGTTFLWINYSHLATQDIVFSSIVTSGILFSIKATKLNKDWIWRKRVSYQRVQGRLQQLRKIKRNIAASADTIYQLF